MTAGEWNPGSLLALSGSYWQTCALHAAVKLDLFTAIGDERIDAAAVARRIDGDARGVEMLLNALTALELLEKSEGGFTNTPAAQTFLSKSSKRYIGHMVMHHLSDPTQSILEMWRALRPGGTVAVIDLLPHRQHWMVEDMGDIKLGWDPLELSRRFTRAGFADVHAEDLDDLYQVEDSAGKRIDLGMFALFARRPAEG